MVAITSCSNDDNVPRQLEMSEYWMMPSTDFGSNLKSVATTEAARGFSVSQNGNKLSLLQTVESVPFAWEYVGDADGNYRYAKCMLANGFADQLKAYLIGKGYAEQADYSFNASYTVLVNQASKLFVSIYSGTGSAKAGNDYFLFGPYDESLYSWTRLGTLKSDLGMLTPLLGYGCNAELIKDYEARAGHIVHKNTDEAKGFYFYETKDAMFPAVAYWLDEETKTKLVETRLYFDSNKMPESSRIIEMLGKLGYHYTYSIDGTDESQIFFDYDAKKTIYVAYSKPENYEGTFLPCIKFTEVNMENNLPPLSVDFPWLPTNVYQMSIDEAIKWVEGQSWYAGREADYFDVWPMFKTKYPEFPYVVLMDDEGFYASGIVFAETSLVLRALSIRETITGKYGCVYKEGSSLYPTFINNDAEVPYEFQYVYDEGMWGYPALIVEPQ
ncbi:MAG: hypothetical protein J6M53_08980 [Bacteroidaceae bacterium]|nr:hypothetical protein [Bacteroidaceae bacterium]